MSREEYDPTIEPSWKFERSLGLWSYMDEPFTSSIFNSKLALESEGFVKVTLPVLSKTSSSWQEFLSQIPQAKGPCKGWLWQLSLEIMPMKAPVTDEGQLRACKWLVEQFNKQIWSLYRRKSLGAIIYSGHVNDLGFYWDLEQLEQFINWISEVKTDALSSSIRDIAKECLHTSDLKRWKKEAAESLWAKLYTLIILSQYWHYLASGLEEDCPSLVQLDLNGLTLQEQIFLLVQPLFDHVRLIAKGAHPKLSSLNEENAAIVRARAAPAKLALLAPSKMNIEMASWLALAMQSLDKAGLDYKIIQEADLVFEWQDVEELIVFASEVSDLALRSLRGFKASSGEIYAIGKNSQLVNLLSQWPSALADLLLNQECKEG